MEVPEVSAVCLRDVLQEIMHTMRVRARPQGLQLVLETAPDLPEVVRSEGVGE